MGASRAQIDALIAIADELIELDLPQLAQRILRALNDNTDPSPDDVEDRLEKKRIADRERLRMKRQKRDMSQDVARHVAPMSRDKSDKNATDPSGVARPSEPLPLSLSGPNSAESERIEEETHISEQRSERATREGRSQFVALKVADVARHVAPMSHATNLWRIWSGKETGGRAHRERLEHAWEELEPLAKSQGKSVEMLFEQAVKRWRADPNVSKKNLSICVLCSQILDWARPTTNGAHAPTLEEFDASGSDFEVNHG